MVLLRNITKELFCKWKWRSNNSLCWNHSYQQTQSPLPQ